jgi:hypothetical protein
MSFNNLLFDFRNSLAAVHFAVLEAGFFAPLAVFEGADFLAVFFFAELVPLFFAAIFNTFSFP